MKAKTATVQLDTADADGVCQSQTPGAAGNLTINGALASGGVATFDAARRVLFTFVGNEAARTFTVYGTDRNGYVISEAVTGTASTAYTNADFLTVTRVAVDDATAGALTVGTNGVGSSEWLVMSTNLNPFSIVLAAVISGTVTYTVEHTMDDVQSYLSTPTPFDHASMAAETTNTDGNYAYPINALRVKVTAGTGTVTLTARQAG